MTTINCDMGEAFGLYKMGDDAGLMPFIDIANVACGFHASDFNHMRATVRLAKAHGVRVGAHPSLPDLQGFGRREMKMGREELANCLIYQIGALNGFLDAEGMTLNHIKPHGSLYGMAARNEETAHCRLRRGGRLQDAAAWHDRHAAREGLSRARRHDFIAEFYADLDYSDDGGVIITRVHDAKDPVEAAAKCVRAMNEGKVRTVGGLDVSVGADTICVHSDTPNAEAIAAAVRAVVTPFVELNQRTSMAQILSPLPGTFYRKPAPDKPAFKSEGDTVAVGDVIGLIEVMKSFIEVHADMAGKIVKFVVDNEEPVMAGQPLVEVDLTMAFLATPDRQSRRDRRAHHRAARELGMTTVQAHSAADAESLAVKMADEAVNIGPPHAAKSYLNIAAILAAADATGAERFIRAMAFSPRTLLSPTRWRPPAWSSSAPRARRFAPWATRSRHAVALAKRACRSCRARMAASPIRARRARSPPSIGFPVMIKAAAGGGGRGIRIVETTRASKSASIRPPPKPRPPSATAAFIWKK